MSSRTQQVNCTALALISALALGVVLLAMPAAATAAPSPMLSPVAAYDGDGQAIDVPFWQRPGNARVLSLSATGVVGYDPPGPQSLFELFDPNNAFEGGPVAISQCVAQFGCGTGQGACGFVFTMTLPFHTLTDPESGCYGLFASSSASRAGTWTVDVPITAEDDQGNPLVFDHWSVPGAITTMEPLTNVPRCRTGDLGLVDGLNVQAVPDPQAAFTTAAEFRAWTDYPNGLGGPTRYEAHYVPRSPDTTAPLIAISRPYDCRYLAKDALVEPEFRCDDMGGSGVQSCAVTGDVTAGGKLDTSTTGDHSLTVTATDNEGNTRSRSVRFFVDGGPPDLTITASPGTPTGDNGWYDAAQLGAGETLPLTVTATDTQAGMWRAWCRLDGWSEDRWVNSTDSSDPQRFPPVTPVVAPVTAYSIDQGTHTLSCHAQDRLGQDSGVVTRTFKVDTIAPPRARFINEFFDHVTYCHPIHSEELAVFPAYLPRQVKWVADPDDASGLVEPPAASGFLDADTTPTSLQRTLTAPTAVDAAGNSAPGSVCTYKVGPTSSFVPASPTYDVRSGDQLTVPAPGVLTDATGATPSTPLTILTLDDWSGIPGATFTGPSAGGAFDATMPARSPSSSSISATYSWQGQESSGLRTTPATVTVRLLQDTDLVNGGTAGCQVTAYPVSRQLRGPQPTQVWGRATYRCTEGDGAYKLNITLLRGSKKVSTVAIPVGTSATTSSIRLGTPAACATGDGAKYATLVSLTGKGIRLRAVQGEAVLGCAGP